MNFRHVRIALNVFMTLALIVLMAFQVTGELAHEWLGIGMVALVIGHHIINRRWYTALRRGKYGAYRVCLTTVAALLGVSFAVTVLCGLSLNRYALPMLSGFLTTAPARQMHLSLSHWTNTLMGLHLGLHMPGIIGRQVGGRRWFVALLALPAAGGLYFFVSQNVASYMLFQSAFAFFDYGEPFIAPLGRNALMLYMWVYVGYGAALELTRRHTAN